MRISKLYRVLLICILVVFNIKLVLSTTDQLDNSRGSGESGENNSATLSTGSESHKNPENNQNQTTSNGSAELNVTNLSQQPASDTNSIKPPTTDSDFQIFTLDATDTVNVKENDSSMYVVKKLRYGFKYVFKEGVMCQEVRYNDRVAWAHSAEEHGDHYPVSLYYSSFHKSLDVIFSNRWFYCYEFAEGGWKFNYKKSEGRALFYSLNIPCSIEDVDFYDRTTRYYVTRHRHKVIFSFVDLTKCTRISVCNSTVWQYVREKYYNNFPRSAVFNFDIKVLTVCFKNEEYFSFKLEGGRWVPYPALSSRVYF